MKSSHRFKILFAIRAVGQFHYYRSIISSLVGMGHQVTVLFDQQLSENDSWLPVEQAKREADFECGWMKRRRGFWRAVIFPAREIRSYIRHFGIGSLPHRDWRRYTPLWFRIFIKLPGARSLVQTAIIKNFVRWLEDVVPADVDIARDIVDYDPDVVVAGPTNLQQSEEAEYAKAAKSLGIPVVIPVLSWDNMTTKGVLPIVPDLLLVWNEAHAEAAKIDHLIPEERIKVVGSPFFDAWFADFKPSCDRKDFCARHGLDPDRPIVLYLGSSRNIVHNETDLIHSLHRAITGSEDRRLHSMQIIVRPHPANFKIFKEIILEDVKVLPKDGTLPIARDVLQLFYDSLFYSVAAVGINTSGFIDAIIAGKPVVAISLPEYAPIQEDLRYFKDLIDSGAIALARDLDQLQMQLKNILDGRDVYKDKRANFVQKFIRPRGPAISAGEEAAHEILKLINTHE